MIEPVQELRALKKHLKGEQEKNDEEEKEKNATSDTVKNSTHQYGRGFSEPFTGTIPFDLTWPTPKIERNKVSGSLESYQPFIPPLNYKLDEVVSKPNEPDVLTNWKNFDFLENAKL